MALSSWGLCVCACVYVCFVPPCDCGVEKGDEGPLLVKWVNSHSLDICAWRRKEGWGGVEGIKEMGTGRNVFQEKKKKKIALFMCPTSQLLFQSSAPLPLRRDPQLCSGAVWSSCD